MCKWLNDSTSCRCSQLHLTFCFCSLLMPKTSWAKFSLCHCNHTTAVYCFYTTLWTNFFHVRLLQTLLSLFSETSSWSGRVLCIHGASSNIQTITSQICKHLRSYSFTLTTCLHYIHPVYIIYTVHTLFLFPMSACLRIFIYSSNNASYFNMLSNFILF